MNHLTENEILDFLDGNTSLEEINNVKNHLAECKECARNLKIFENISAELKNNLQIKTKPTFTYTILNRLNLIHSKKSTPLIFKILISTFIMLIFITIILMLTFTFSNTTSNISTEFDLNNFLSKILTLVEKMVGFIKYQRKDILLSLTLIIFFYFISEFLYSKLKIKRK